MKEHNANMVAWRGRQLAKQTGFSLIELMVGMLVSIVCVLAMMAAFAAYEGPKRTTTSGDDAQQNGSYSLFELERQIRTAGSGLTPAATSCAWPGPTTGRRPCGTAGRTPPPSIPFAG